MSSLSHRRCLLACQAAAILALTAWLYAPVALPMLRQCWQDPNYTYGFFVPVFALFLLWEDRARLASLPLKPAWSGLILFILALLLLMLGIVSHEFFLSRLSFLLLIVGMVVFFAGWKHLRAMAFPLTFFIVMLPSSTLSDHVTFPLQILSSKIATLFLLLAGVPALREGNIILLHAARLGVTEACSGIRFLFTLITLAVIYGYLVESRMGRRLLLALAAAPISVLANAFRIAATGFVVQHWGVQRAEGTLHIFSGWLVFLASLAMIFALHRLLQFFFPAGLRVPPRQEYAA